MPAGTRTCSCGVTAVGLSSHWRGAGGWRQIGDQALCPECASRHYRKIGSSLALPTGPPAPLLASAPWRASSNSGRREASGRREEASDLVRAAERQLIADPSRTDKEIAQELGCSYHPVWHARQRLRERGALPPPPPTKIELAVEALRADPSRSAKEIAGELGCGRDVVYTARKRLRDLGG